MVVTCYYCGKEFETPYRVMIPVCKVCERDGHNKPRQQITCTKHYTTIFAPGSVCKSCMDEMVEGAD